jgi:TonB family protein
MDPERRKLPRKAPAEFNFIRIEQEHIGRVLNFSEEGLCFETMSPIGDQDVVQFLFSVRLLDGIEGVGNIVWMNEAKNMGGIKIVHLSRTSRQKIHGLINQIAEVEAIVGADPAREINSGAAANVKEPKAGEAAESLAPQITKPTAAADLPRPIAESKAKDSERGEIVEPVAPSLPKLQTDDSPVGLEMTGPTVEEKAGEPKPWEVQQRPAASVEWPLPMRETAETKTAAAADAPAPAEPVRPRIPKWPTPSNAKPAIPDASAPLPAAQDDLLATTPTTWKEAATLPMDGMESSGAVEARELVPLRRHLAVQKSQFIRGVVIGIAACFLVAWVVFKFSRPLAPSVSAEVAPPPTTVGNPIVEPSANPVVALASIAQAPTKKPHDSARSNPPRSSKIIPGAVEQSSGTLKSVSNNVAATDSGQPVPAAENVASPPATSSSANAVPAVRSGGFFEPFNRITVPTDAFKSTSRASSGPTDVPSGADSSAESSFPEFHRKGPIVAPPVGGIIKPARLLKSYPPSYPMEAKKKGIAGDVVVDAVVNQFGSLASVQVLSGPTLLRQAALDAVSQWKYQPAMLDGKPTTEHVTITIKFHAKPE